MPGKGTIKFHVECGTGETENLCTVKVTATSGDTPALAFDESFDFAPGSTAPEIAQYFANKMKEAGFKVDYKAGSSTLACDNLTKIDGGSSKGRQVEMDIGGATGVEHPPAVDLPKPKDIKLTRGILTSGGTLWIAGAGVEWTELPPEELEAEIRVDDIPVSYTAAQTGAQVMAGVLAALLDEGWVATAVDSTTVRVTEVSGGRNCVSLSITPSGDDDDPTEDHWELGFAD